MVQWLSQYVPEWFASFTLSLVAAFWGVMMRLGHAAARNNERVTFRHLWLEVPTLFGMAIIAGPMGRWLHTNYDVDLEITFALCVVFGYLGANIINRIATWLEKRGAPNEKNP